METTTEPVKYKIGNEKLIRVLDAASAKLRALLERQGRAHGALRVSVIGGGCSGLQYKMDLVDGPRGCRSKECALCQWVGTGFQRRPPEGRLQGFESKRCGALLLRRKLFRISQPVAGLFYFLRRQAWRTRLRYST